MKTDEHLTMLASAVLLLTVVVLKLKQKNKEVRG